MIFVIDSRIANVRLPRYNNYHKVIWIMEWGEFVMKHYLKKVVAGILILSFFLAAFSGVAEVNAFAADGSTVVYITDTGKCYHTEKCSCLRKSKHEISLEEAVIAGYSACSKCKAPELTSSLKDKSSENTNSKVSTKAGTYEYVLNTNTMKFHYADCASAKKIKAANKSTSTLTAEELISSGYSPCGNCKPK